MSLTWSVTLWLGDFETVDHIELGTARMIWQYRGDQPRLQGILASYLLTIQSAEDVSLETWCGLWPLTAIGIQLDNLGKIVGQPRGEFSDDQYRLWILARILVNRSNGTVPEVTEILDLLGVTADVYIDEYYPASVTISVIDQPYGDVIGDIVGDWKPGGVALHWIWNEEEDAFQFASTLGADEVDVDTGFGDLTGVTQTTGGYFSGGRVY